MMKRSRARKIDHTLIGLADARRRAILKRLARGEARVTDLARPFSISLNAVSKHIKLLERAGLVRRRRVGREHFLRYRPEPLESIQNWIAMQQNYWKAGLEALDRLLQKEDELQEKGQ